MVAPHMRVIGRRAQGTVSQNSLNGEQIDAGFQQFRGERVPQRMRVEAPFQPRSDPRRAHILSMEAMLRGRSGLWLGNSHTGLRCVCQNNLSSVRSLGDNGTSLCLFPLPRETRIVIRRLSMSLTFSCTASPTRMPVAYIVVSSIRCLRGRMHCRNFRTSSRLRTTGTRFGFLPKGSRGMSVLRPSVVP